MLGFAVEVPSMSFPRVSIMDPESAARVDAVCDAFEREWREGREPEIAAAVGSVDVELRNVLAQQLMLVDAEYRRARYGVAPSVEEYSAMLMIDLAAEMDTLGGAEGLRDTPTGRAGSRGDDLDGESRPEDRPGYRLGDGAGQAEIGPRIPGYEILSELGRGGMGIVYKARQIRAGRLVALKTIHAPHLANHEHIRRFQAESKAAARLTHPGIVPVFEVGEFNHVHFFSMGFIDGPNLEMMAREQVLSSQAAAEICRDLADALEYAHRQGVIHRDIKPLNILIGPDGKPRLTDFGLARLKDQDQGLTSTGQIIGTATYMPPENATGSDADAGATTDIYSLGATLYRCITGRPPFQAATTMEVLRQVTNDEPVSPRRLNREIDVDIETLCLKCLEKEPSRRFQNAGELSAELTRYLNHEPIHSRPISTATRAWRWCLRRPSAAASILMGILLLTAVVAGIPFIQLQHKKLQLADLQRQRDMDAREKAEAAQQAEEQSRRQAEKLAAANAARAATQEYFVSIMKVRELRMQPDPKAGWTWEALDLLEKAATSDADGKDPIALRSLIADTLMTSDLREIGRIEKLPHTKSLAVSHDGKLLAAGDWSGSPSQVRIYRILTTSNDDNQQSVQFELIRTCSVNTVADYIQSEMIEKGLQSGTTKREGMWALDFSPDGTKIAVGTRNGNITIWKIDCDPPQIEFDKRYPEKGTDRLCYSPDGRQIIVDYRDPATLRVFDVDTQSDRVATFDEHVDFGLMPDGRILASRDGMISRISADSFADSVEFTQDGRFIHIGTDSGRALAITGTVPATLLDPITGEKSLVLQQSASDPNRPFDLTFAADTTIAFASLQPQNLKLWDAISGKQLVVISYPGNDPPLICTGRERDRVYVYSTVNTFAYRIRCLQPLQGNNEPPSSLANATSPMAAIVPGTQVLCDFALSNDQQHMAVVEAASLSGLQTIPDGYRARLRKLNTSDGEETARWTCLLLSSGENRNTLTEGDAVTFLNNDGEIAFTTPAVGNIAVVSESGFHFPSSAGLDVQQSDPIVTAADTTTWTGGKVPAVSETVGFRPAIELKLPRGLTQSKERLRLRLIAGEKVRDYEVADRHLDSSGWHLIFLDQFTEAFESGTWRIEASLVQSDLHFDSTAHETVAAADGIDAIPMEPSPFILSEATPCYDPERNEGPCATGPREGDSSLIAQNDRGFAQNDKHLKDGSAAFDNSAIRVGRLFLLPWKRMKRGNTPPVYPLRLGPLAQRWDRGLAAVVEGYTLHQWNSNLSEIAAAPWRDFASSEEDIKGLSQSRKGCFVGTDSGLVAIVNPDGSQELVEPAHTERGTYDSRNGVLATTIADEAGLAFAGNLRGQIKVYDLVRNGGAPVSITDAHDREIVAMAITADGQWLASAAADGVLRLWQRRNEKLKLLYELTGEGTLVVTMKFSQDGHFLYVLRKGQRGIRRINLAQLDSHFSRLGIGSEE